MNLSAWQKAQIARHPARPHCLDYIKAFVEDFTPLAGDRCFADDEAMVCGIGKIDGYAVVVMGRKKETTLKPVSNIISVWQSLKGTAKRSV